MGDATIADPALIPDFSCMDPEHFYVGKRYLHARANYVLETDNIMDLSHIQYLHPGTLGSSTVSDAITSVKQVGDTVYSNRQTIAEIMPDFLYAAMQIPHGQPVDRWIDVRWDAPANMLLDAGAVATGMPRSEGKSFRAALVHTGDRNHHPLLVRVLHAENAGRVWQAGSRGAGPGFERAIHERGFTNARSTAEDDGRRRFLVAQASPAGRRRRRNPRPPCTG
jgi:phenylpropionate dioxygenase-like ring-hydroxylating dioxygenase large terminal subunit